MKLEDVIDKKIGIFGYGTEGRALFEYLSSHGAKDITIFDENVDEGHPALVKGPFRAENCEAIEIAFRSPGINPQSLQEIIPQSAAITSLTNLFFSNRRGKIVAVTGTKGKSTTVGLVAQILKQNGSKHFVGGNIGKAPLDFLDETADDTYSVLELSSFQTEDLESAPDIAIILPISADHLDYHISQGEHFNVHKSHEEYLKAKGQLVINMADDSLIVAYDDENVGEIVSPSAARKVNFDLVKSETAACFLEEGKAKCSLDSRTAEYEGIDELSQQNKVPAVNILAAITFGFALDLKVDAKLMLSTFERLPFRIELVGKSDSITFYNDSAATNPVSAIAAMKTMTEDYVLICGGSSKGLSFKELAETAKQDQKLIKVFLFGQTAGEINSDLKLAGFQKPIVLKENLGEVMDEIKKAPDGAKAVLFSPASASFDQFKNYRQRGEYFNSLVEKWQNT